MHLNSISLMSSWPLWPLSKVSLGKRKMVCPHEHFTAKQLGLWGYFQQDLSLQFTTGESARQVYHSLA